MIKNITNADVLFLLIALILVFADCAAKKEKRMDHFGTQVNHPKFTGPVDFARSYNRVTKIFVFGKLDGEKVLKPWVDEDGWLTPAFREQLCMVVTLNNHCVG